jgi:hypothetical protein
MWTDQKLQTVSINTGLKYFRVRCKDNTINSDDDQMIERLLQRAKERENDSINRDELIKEKEGPGEESPWLARTGWKRMFMGRNMQEMVKYTVTEQGWSSRGSGRDRAFSRSKLKCIGRKSSTSPIDSTSRYMCARSARRVTLSHFTVRSEHQVFPSNPISVELDVLLLSARSPRASKKPPGSCSPDATRLLTR